MKSQIKSKVVWLNVITFILFVIDVVSQQSIIPVDYVPYIVIIVAIMNYILRVYFTREPIGKG